MRRFSLVGFVSYTRIGKLICREGIVGRVGDAGQAAVRRYLRQRGCPAEELSPAVVKRLVAMANDAATPCAANVSGKCANSATRGIDWRIITKPQAVLVKPASPIHNAFI